MEADEQLQHRLTVLKDVRDLLGEEHREAKLDARIDELEHIIDQLQTADDPEADAPADEAVEQERDQPEPIDATEEADEDADDEAEEDDTEDVEANDQADDDQEDGVRHNCKHCGKYFEDARGRGPHEKHCDERPAEEQEANDSDDRPVMEVRVERLQNEMEPGERYTSDEIAAMALDQPERNVDASDRAKTAMVRNKIGVESEDDPDRANGKLYYLPADDDFLGNGEGVRRPTTA